jgi:endonuclease/exonuclease/phosphatase family metal-dependent hydrolase
MRVMAWNVWWRFGGNWREREAGIVATLDAYRPDLLGLVETWSGDGTDQPHRLAARYGMHAAWAPTSLPPAPDPVEYPDQHGVEVGLGLVSRWPILATEIHDLPHEQRGGPPPTALLVTVDHPRGPLHVVVACIEWEPRFAADQLAQSRALAALATDRRLDGPLPVLLVGDLNAAVDQEDLAPLVDVMVDTWSAAGGDPAAVTLDSALPFAPVEAVKQIDRRIDHVFARAGRLGHPLPVHGAFLAGDRPIGGVYPSDHYAVGIDLEP